VDGDGQTEIAAPAGFGTDVVDVAGADAGGFGSEDGADARSDGVPVASAGPDAFATDEGVLADADGRTEFGAGGEEARPADAGVAAEGSGLGGFGPLGSFDGGRAVSDDAEARAADFGDFAVADARREARADGGPAMDGRVVDGGDERDGAGNQPDASQDHTRNPREGEAA
jgi:hypothetical protein